MTAHVVTAEHLDDRRRSFLDGLMGLAADPRRFVTRAALVLLAIEAALVAAHLLVTGLFGATAALTADGHIGAFDLDDEATLAVWFSSFQLLLLACTCRLIGWIDADRPLPIDSQRVWSHASLLFLFMAIDETAGLHELVGKLGATVAAGLPIEMSVWWTVPYAVGLAPILFYAALQISHRPRLSFGVGAGIACWLVANCLERVRITSGPLNVALEEGFEMVGATVLLVTFGMYLLTSYRALSCSETNGGTATATCARA